MSATSLNFANPKNTKTFLTYDKERKCETVIRREFETWPILANQTLHFKPLIDQPIKVWKIYLLPNKVTMHMRIVLQNVKTPLYSFGSYQEGQRC